MPINAPDRLDCLADPINALQCGIGPAPPYRPTIRPIPGMMVDTLNPLRSRVYPSRTAENQRRTARNIDLPDSGGNNAERCKTPNGTPRTARKQILSARGYPIPRKPNGWCQSSSELARR